MTRTPFPPSPARRAAPAAKGVTDFLRTHDRMAALLPAASRLAALQRDCSSILPAAFDPCVVLKFEDGQLTLSTPNAALGSKLKQQLPKLQASLAQLGWQVNAIRLKLQPGNIDKKPRKIKQLVLPSEAISSFEALHGALEDTPQNAALKGAISALLKRHRGM